MQPYTENSFINDPPYKTMIQPSQEQEIASSTPALTEAEMPNHSPAAINQPTQGTVKWFNEKKGFGFIVDPNFEGDIFVHYSEIQVNGFKTLQEGDRVEYELYKDGKGAKARRVVRLS